MWLIFGSKSGVLGHTVSYTLTISVEVSYSPHGHLHRFTARVISGGGCYQQTPDDKRYSDYDADRASD